MSSVLQPRLKGRAFLVRYADDFVMGFACEQDARRVLDVLPKRFGKYGLTLHPDKTRLVPFVRPSNRPATDGSRVPPGKSFDFLGFTHFWSRSKQGNWVVKQRHLDGWRQTPRLARGLRRLGEQIQRPGWDALVEVSAHAEFVPQGVSAWEMGVDKDPKKKAAEDPS